MPYDDDDFYGLVLDKRMRLQYSHRRGWFKWMPFRMQDALVQRWNKTVCRLKGHHWVGPVDREGFSVPRTCLYCKEIYDERDSYS